MKDTAEALKRGCFLAVLMVLIAVFVWQTPVDRLPLTDQMTPSIELNTRRRADQNKLEQPIIVVADQASAGNVTESPQTGDLTPIAGMLFMAMCGLVLGIMEILRRVKY